MLRRVVEECVSTTKGRLFTLNTSPLIMLCLTTFATFHVSRVLKIDL